jgi:hypothetical protein
MMKQRTEAARRSLERRQREDAAPRLRDEVPQLESLVLGFVTRRGSLAIGELSYTRRVVVDSAPALFEVACPDRACDGGGYDITRSLLRHLVAGDTTMTGTQECGGSMGSAACNCVLEFTGTATYRTGQ